MIINTEIFNFYSYDRGFWFRIFDWGLSVNQHPLLFSHRNGHKKYIKIGKWKIEGLKSYVSKEKKT